MSTSPLHPRSNGDVEDNRPALPTFAPTRPHSDTIERGESSASGSLRSRDPSEESQSFRGSIQSTTNGDRPSSDGNSSPDVRRHSHRSSGGFLLNSIGRSSRIPKLLHNTTDNPKGKRKHEQSELSVVKTRYPKTHPRPSSSIGASPLSTELKRDRSQVQRNGNGFAAESGSIGRSLSPSRAGTESLRYGSEAPSDSSRIPTPNVGFDTDPAQIVSMALSLSKARRQQASARRYVSSEQRGNRVTSAATSGGATDKPSSGSIGQYLKTSRPGSRGSKERRPTTPQSKVRDTSAKYEQAPPDTTAEPITDDTRMEESEPSHATAARVQRARTYFELAYEHRRLISHLPPLRRPGAQARSPSPDSKSKAYNPLQYIRNRKLRIWDKSAINAEAEGWHDIDKVRSWVDAVVVSHTETRHDPTEVVRLPLLDESEQTLEARGAKMGANGHKTSPDLSEPVARPRRPRSDWVTHPGDLIADCCWLEQGMNKVKILDRDNNHIYPSDTHFKFAGWRNRTPVDVPMNLQQHTPPPEEDEYMRDERIETAPEAVPVKLPTFKSASHAFGRSVRGRKRDRIKDTFVADGDGSSKKGLKNFMDDSESASDSSRDPGLSEDEADRGRKRLMKQRQKVDSTDGSPMARSTIGDASRDSNGASHTMSDKSHPSSTQNSKRGSIDHSHFTKFLKRDSHKGQTPLSRSQNRDDHSRPRSTFKFPSFQDQPRSSAEYDSTAPSSPTGPTWPSIAINLSPPHSRSPSPSKKTLSSVLNPFNHHSQSKNSGIESTDFAGSVSQQSSRHISSDNDQQDAERGSREPSPMTRGHSPMTRSATQATVDPAMSPVYHRDSNASRASNRSARSSAHDAGKIRGFFKGGRIAEIVGNEVSRVGNYVWKRDVPAGGRRAGGSMSDTSLRSYSGSDGETPMNGTILKTPPRPANQRTRSSTKSTPNSDKSPENSKSTPSSADRPAYHNPNLPSFTSPFQKDKDQHDKKQQLLSPTSSNDDHISRIAAEHRSASRSPRLNKLAPPKLDTGRSNSPGGPDGLSRSASYGFSEGLRLTRSQEASDQLHNALNGKASPGGLQHSRSAMGLARISSADILSEDAQTHNVTSRDIERALVFIYSSVVKAREIGRRADLPRGFTPKYLLESVTEDHTDQHHLDLSMVSRKEEHVVAARNIMARLSAQAESVDDQLKQFSTVTAPGLHTRLQTLEDLVDNKMTPRVRTTADEAGKLSMKLTTTSTLAIKEMNDTIDGAIRRRRRGPIRWVRRLWYSSIEYAVVSLLWGIWAVVTLIRSVLGILTGSTRTARWLLWID